MSMYGKNQILKLGKIKENKQLENTNSILETYVYIEILDTYSMFILLKVRQIDKSILIP